MNSHAKMETGCRFDFGSIAGTYDRWFATRAGMAHDLAQKTDALCLLGDTQKGTRLLDVGCGTGHWSRFFATLGYTVVAVDLSLEMAKVAHHQCSPDMAFHVADGGALPFREASFEVAAAMAAIEFVVSPLATLGEMARCVRKGGRILIGTLNRSAPLNRRRIEEGRQPYVSARLYSPGELRELLRPFGRVRMAASDPDGIAWTRNADEWSPPRKPIFAEAPFIVAEVQR